MSQTRAILDRLIGFDTVSHRSNLGLLSYVQSLLDAAGIDSVTIPDLTGEKANLYAIVGPKDVPGVILSGHVDVVPVEGQDWSHDPFTMRDKDGRLYGRGTTDMKGFVASAVATMLNASKRDLRVPLILALSHDEEVGCQGVGSMIDDMAGWTVMPRYCLVGEPTGMEAAIGHKGKVALRVTCTGRAGHSSNAPGALNAIHLAADFIAEVRKQQADVAQNGPFDYDFDVPYSTLHVGKIQGGVQVNVVAHCCVLDMEIRSLPEDSPALRIEALETAAEAIVAPLRSEFPEAAIQIAQLWNYPGLATIPSAEVVGFVTSLTGRNGLTKVAYGTEGGMYAARLGVPTVVCGPGHMEQGHMPDEYIELSQLAECDAMLARLLDRCEVGF